MTNKNKIVNKKNLEWFQHFTQVCDKHDIWYVVDNGTLLGTIRHKGVIPWDDDFDVRMTKESYEKLKNIFPTNCIDGTMTKDYPLIIPKFVPNNKNFLESNIFVDIFIIVPTIEWKVRNFRSFKNKLKFSMECVHTTWKPYAWYIYLLKIFTYPFKWMNTKMTYKTSLDILYEEKYTGFYTIDNPIDSIKINWINNFSFKRVLYKFENFKVWVPEEYEQILIDKYTINYMVPKKESRPFIHFNAVSIRYRTKEERKYINNLGD